MVELAERPVADVRARPGKDVREEAAVQLVERGAGRAARRVPAEQQEARPQRLVAQAPAQVRGDPRAHARLGVVVAAQRGDEGALEAGQRIDVDCARQVPLVSEMVIEAPDAGARAGAHLLDRGGHRAALHEDLERRAENGFTTRWGGDRH